jgi:hypothetical protein
MSPDMRKHRGAHPADRALFAADQLPKLQSAVSDLSWLLTRSYSMKGAVKLVGDRFGLNERQRLAMSRAACSDQSKSQRAIAHAPFAAVKEQNFIIDGFNLIITIEAALSGGLLMRCRDGCIRDLSSIHGSYRSVEETEAAILLIGESLSALSTASVLWMLDKPISNSGRLAQRIRRLAAQRGWIWSVELAFNPDREIAGSNRVVISSDGPLLDQVQHWTNLAQDIIEKDIADPWLIDLKSDTDFSV